MRVVAGWVASCNDLALDELDDLNLALETLLAAESSYGEPLTLTLWVVDRKVEVLLEGLQSEALRANLAGGPSFEPSPEWPLDIRLFLSALVDSYEVVGCGTTVFGVSMHKRVG
jgi:hypothetical protein